MKVENKTGKPEKTDAEKRLCRLWHLYTARIGAIDPNSDLRGIDKICRDELQIANHALKIFEQNAGEVK